MLTGTQSKIDYLRHVWHRVTLPLDPMHRLGFEPENKEPFAKSQTEQQLPRSLTSHLFIRTNKTLKKIETSVYIDI